jgi:hypothetical protein
MPITQERFIDQINASLDILQGLRNLIQTIHSHHRSVLSGRMTYEDAHNYIIAMASESFLLNNPESIAIIMTERRHFAANQSRNARKAALMARQRRTDGKPTRAATEMRTLAPIPSHPTLTNQLPETSPEAQMAEDDRIAAAAAWNDPELQRQLEEADRKRNVLPTPPQPPPDAWDEESEN